MVRLTLPPGSGSSVSPVSLSVSQYWETILPFVLVLVARCPAVPFR